MGTPSAWALPLLGHSWSYLLPLFEQQSVSQLSALRRCACADAPHPVPLGDLCVRVSYVLCVRVSLS
jgi:hypothetical protein